MDQLNQIRNLHAHVSVRLRGTDHVFLLNDEEFRFAAQCERMRVDRNGSVLSLLLITLPKPDVDQPGIEFLAKLLEGRLRTTDTPGLLADGRVAVLLPDTSSEGAWKVAADISEVFPPGPTRPECDVRVYPTSGRQQGFDRINKKDSSEAAEEDCDSAQLEEDDFFFARALPIWKRTVDICGSLFGLAITAPLLTVAAVGVKTTSRGPAFFTQEREGLAGRKFKIWKLRTMCEDAEDLKHGLQAHSHQDGPAFKIHRDPRTTTIGRFLRWSSIDELPQFWNVLRGDMSLVGPRPLPTDESAACVGWQRRRLNVVPGMTCTWQVCARGSVTFDDWVRMDLRYLKKQGVWEDTKLLLATLPSILFRRGMR